jgi:hypothetical protein
MVDKHPSDAPYAAPKLIVLGDAKKLTAAGTGISAEGNGSNKNKKDRRP